MMLRNNKIIKIIFQWIPLWILLFCCLVIVIEISSSYFNHFWGKGESSTTLEIKTYLAGKDQPTHPSIIDLKDNCRGYRYWMAFSPYPFMSGEEENPCVAVSDDLYNWKTPSGLYNPIAFNEETNCDELKDPHILYNCSTDSLEVWYLGRIDGTIESGSDLLQFRKKSNDGVHWSDYEIMDTVNGFLSPSVIYDNELFKYWTIKPSSKTHKGGLWYKQSIDGRIWNTYVECKFGGDLGLENIWHGAVTLDSIYRFVFVESVNKSDRILYSESYDGINWSLPQPIITKGVLREYFYRPCIVTNEDSVYCVYGVVDKDNVWKLALSSAKSPEKFMTINNHRPLISELISFYKPSLKNIREILNGGLLNISLVCTLFMVYYMKTEIRLTRLWIYIWIISLSPYVFKIDFKILNWTLFILLSGLISLLSLLVNVGIKRLIDHFK